MRSQEKLTAQSYLSVLTFLRDTTHFYLKLIYIRYLLQDNTSIFPRYTYIVSIDYIQMFFILNLFHIEEITCCDKAKFSIYRLREFPFFSSLTVLHEASKRPKILSFPKHLCLFNTIFKCLQGKIMIWLKTTSISRNEYTSNGRLLRFINKMFLRKIRKVFKCFSVILSTDGITWLLKMIRHIYVIFVLFILISNSKTIFTNWT